MTFLLDPRDYPTVLKHNQALSFAPIAREISSRVFGYEEIYSKDLAEEEMRAGYHRHLRPGTMGPLVERTHEGLAQSLAERLGGLPKGADGWLDASLQELVARSVFEAGTFAMFGEEACDEPTRERFMNFDANFNRLVAGVPLRLLGTTRDDRDWITGRLRRLWPGTSAFIRERQEMLGQHVGEMEVARVQLSMLWASQANTIPAAFWALAFLLENADALATVRAEVDRLAIREDDGTAHFGPEQLKQMRYLDSAISEALRLCSGATTIRAVVEPVTLELTGGRSCALRRGDYVCMFPFISHRDPEIFEEPEEYRFDRFYSERGSAQFFKGGERLGIALMPFGGGETMCPGRFLARNEIKILVGMLLATYEIERAPSQERPAFDLSRAGLGILTPAGPLAVRLRPRSLS